MSARQGIICANRTASTLKEATLAAAKRVTRKTETLVTVCRIDEMLKYYAHSIPSIIRILYRSFPDINECDQSGTCPKPGTCINTLGSFRCICPRGFKLDQSGRFCIDQNECADDSTCEHGCQVSISSSFLKFSFAFSSFKFVDFSELYGKLSLRVSGRIRSTSLL